MVLSLAVAIILFVSSSSSCALTFGIVICAPSVIVSWSVGSLNVSGSMPKLIRFVLCIRAKLFAMTAFIPRCMGAIAACSLLDPWP